MRCNAKRAGAREGKGKGRKGGRLGRPAGQAGCWAKSAKEAGLNLELGWKRRKEGFIQNQIFFFFSCRAACGRPENTSLSVQAEDKGDGGCMLRYTPGPPNAMSPLGVRVAASRLQC